MRPDHFFCIAKTGNRFCVFDDLKDEVRQFPSFSGAVTGDSQQMQKQHVTTGQVPGIHILIYVKDEHLRSSVTLDYERFDRVYGPRVAHTVPSTVSGNSGGFRQSDQQPQSMNSAAPDSVPHKQHMTAQINQPEIHSQGNDKSFDHPYIQTEVKEKDKPVYNSHMLATSDYLISYTGKWCTLQFQGKLIPVLDKQSRLFVPCNEIILLANFNEIKKNGYSCIDTFCLDRGMVLEDHFIFDENSSPTKRRRLFMSVECASKFFGTRADELQQVLSRRLKRLNDKLQMRSAGEFLDFDEKDVKTFSGTFNCSSKRISFRTFDDDVYLSLKDVVEAFEIEKRVKKSGYGFLDKELNLLELPLDSCFLFNKKTRTDIAEKAVIALIKANVFKKSDSFGQEFLQLLFKEVTVSTSIKKQISTPKRKVYQEHVEVKSSPKKKLKVTMTKKSLFKTSGKKKKKTGAALIKSTLEELCKTHFKGDSDSFFLAFSQVFVSSSSKKFDGTVSVDVLSAMLRSRKDSRSKSKRNLLEKLVCQSAPEVYKLSPLESIFYSDTLSGRRLTDKYRQRLPGVFPSARAERQQKKELKQVFASVLLPRRTASGWKIDVARLLEVLNFKYYLLQSPTVKHWKVHGDGREIGNRQSTFLSINVLNNEALLHGVKFQSPDDVYPFHVFYESDTRDNIEVNLGYGLLNTLPTENVFYLGGDEMFLEAVLDGSSILSPTSNEGWNIYSKSSKNSKSETGSDGLRASLKKTIDRSHPESMFGDAIPTQRVVMCLLHAIARSAEKLLSLEVANILSEANKLNERSSGQGDIYRQTAIGNLEANISKRGVRNGNFRIPFSKSGAPEPISLNKDSAMLILHPDDKDFPHPLTGVLPARTVNIPVANAVRKKLDISPKMTESDFAKQLWECFWKMVTILRKDDMPTPVGHKLSVEDIESHSWGYSELDMEEYCFAAEKFYQLFVARHGALSLTPYMIKLIDHVPQLMKDLPFPIARFQSEGAEHLNYYDSKFYHRKTTRHGGKDRLDPVLASFHHRWLRLYHSIHEYTSAEQKDKLEAGQQFLEFCVRHHSAATIQKVYKGHLIRKQFKDLGWDSYRTASAEVQNSILQQFATCPSPCDMDLPLKGHHFVLSGNLTSVNGKSLTHTSLKKTIVDHGGCVKETVPYRTKTVSAKKYIVVSSTKSVHNKKPAALIQHAVRRGFPVVNSNYIFDTIEKRQRVCPNKYELTTPSQKSNVTRDVTIARRHFTRSKTLKTVIKSRQKRHKSRQSKPPSDSKYVNPSVFFVAEKLRSHKYKLPQKERRKLFRQYLIDWRRMSLHEKQQVSDAWKRRNGETL